MKKKKQNNKTHNFFFFAACLLGQLWRWGWKWCCESRVHIHYILIYCKFVHSWSFLVVVFILYIYEIKIICTSFLCILWMGRRPCNHNFWNNLSKSLEFFFSINLKIFWICFFVVAIVAIVVYCLRFILFGEYYIFIEILTTPKNHYYFCYNFIYVRTQIPGWDGS